MTLQLPAALHQHLLAHALETPTLEVCGLLGGVGATATRLYRIANIAATPQVAFTMDPQAQLAAMLEMRGRGEALVGIYHSHPTTAAQPFGLPGDFEAFVQQWYSGLFVAGLRITFATNNVLPQ